MATALHVIGVFLLLCGIGSIFSSLGAGIFFLALAGGSFLLARYIEDNEDTPRANINSTQEDLNKSRGMLINDVTKINHDYMLELSESDLLDISYSEDPIRAFASKIIPGTPTMATFCLNMETMVNSLLDEMPLSKEKADLVYSIFLDQLISGVSNEIIEEIARNYSQHLPSHLYFLKGKINYELGALGVIETIAQQTNDLSLHNSVEYIRRKRGYID